MNMGYASLAEKSTDSDCQWQEYKRRNAKTVKGTNKSNDLLSCPPTLSLYIYI